MRRKLKPLPAVMSTATIRTTPAVEHKVLSVLLAQFQSAALVKANKLRGLKTSTKKPELIEQLPPDILNEDRTRELFQKLSSPARLVLRKMTQGPEAWHYQPLAIILIQEHGYLDAESLIKELSQLLLILPTPTAELHKWSYAGGNQFDATHPEWYSEIWCPPWVSRAIAGVSESGDGNDVTADPYKKLAFTAPQPINPDAKATLLRAAANDLLQDVIGLLRYLQSKPIFLTKDQMLPKADLRKISKQLHIQEPYESSSYADRQWRPYLDFILNLTQGANLCSVKPGNIFAANDLEGFLRQSLLEKMQRLFHAWLHSIFWDELLRIRELQLYSYSYFGDADFHYRYSLGIARATILHCLSQLPLQQWFVIEDVQKQLHKHAPHFLLGKHEREYAERSFMGKHKGELTYRNIREKKTSFDGEPLLIDKDWFKVEGRFISNVIAEPLFWFGIVDLAKNEQGATVALRISDLGAKLLGMQATEAMPAAAIVPSLIVQPDFEVIVYKEESSADTLWFLAEIAEHLSSQQAARYRLTKQAFYRAWQNGYTFDKIVGFLTSNSKTALPQNVLYSLQEWNDQQERIQFHYDANLIEVESASLGELFQAQFQDRILQKITPTYFAVMTTALHDIIDWLYRQQPSVYMCVYQDVANTLLIDHDLQILLPCAHAHPYHEYKLKLFADLVQTTPDYQLYRITPETMKRGKASGMPGTKVIEWLTFNAIQGLTDDVELILRNLNKEPTLLGIQKVYVMAVENPRLQNQLLAIPELRHLIFWLDTLALVHEANLEPLRQVLCKRNIQLEIGRLPDWITLKPVSPKMMEKKETKGADAGEKLFAQYRKWQARRL